MQIYFCPGTFLCWGYFIAGTKNLRSGWKYFPIRPMLVKVGKNTKFY